MLGLTTEGIWQPKCDVTDVNAASLGDGLLATADDFGYVKLFEYPVTVSFMRFFYLLL